MRAVDEEWRLVNNNKVWFNETVVGQDEDTRIIKRGGGSGGGDGTKRYATRQMEEDQSVDMR